ncbi:MAG: hypothetical protein CFH01_01501 [Alphaproteobacteria bacterium MarineAlpha2_Bin1]|nr:MAG: hypothetical protein CFH01_01501 [Alphaproteobacteria bacterium MarineAlpha2_Bin1]|tara:strand:+ start:872 stop:1147 length:276 start_codon:yes stop_codon:yes gene_type:complete
MLDENYVFVRHQSGQNVSKKEWILTVTDMFSAMNDERLKWKNNRCIYENDEVLVMLNIGNFPDGTKESIIVVHYLENGKIIKTESGATPLD